MHQVPVGNGSWPKWLQIHYCHLIIFFTCSKSSVINWQHAWMSHPHPSHLKCENVLWFLYDLSATLARVSVIFLSTFSGYLHDMPAMSEIFRRAFIKSGIGLSPSPHSPPLPCSTVQILRDCRSHLNVSWSSIVWFHKEEIFAWCWHAFNDVPRSHFLIGPVWVPLQKLQCDKYSSCWIAFGQCL